MTRASPITARIPIRCAASAAAAGVRTVPASRKQVVPLRIISIAARTTPEILVLVRDRLVVGPLDRVEDLGLGHMVRHGSAEDVERGVQVAVDEPGMDGGAGGIDRPIGLVAGGDRRVRADRHDPPAADGDRAVGEDPAFVVHRDDVAVADQEIDAASVFAARATGRATAYATDSGSRRACS